MSNTTDQLTSVGLLVLRVGTGGMMAGGHGLDKVIHFAHKASYFPDPFGFGHAPTLAVATFAEFACSILVILGLATRMALLPLLATMLTAVVVIHAGDAWPDKELALLYLVPFLTLMFTGPGEYSVDMIMGRRHRWMVG
jgi:putative oxidoreductase